MKEFTDKIKKASEKIKSFDREILIVSHLDTDGIASASIMASILLELEKDFQITFVKEISLKIIKSINNKKPELVIFTDIGSGYLDYLSEINVDMIILDHHEVVGELNDNMIMVNPVEHDLEFSGSGTVYMLAKEMLKHDRLAPLAIVGTIGDVSYPTDSRLFDTPLVESEKGLNIYGRYSRPLHEALKYLKILKLSDSSKAIQFLSEIGINPQENGTWRTFESLKDGEKKKLTDAIVKEALNQDKFEIERIFGNVLTLKGFPEELKDAKEFATILNACANMNEPAVGVALCLGSKKALKDAKGLHRGYKKLIANYMNWVRDNPQNIRQSDIVTYILAKDNINENLIGTIVSMLYDSENILVGLANGDNGIKVSVRSKDIDIHETVIKTAELCGGKGGGHNFAAGAKIPFETEQKFIECFEGFLRKTL